jgi:hypothetical protein
MKRSSAGQNPRVLAISSGGGHWVQLMRLRSAFDGCEVIYAVSEIAECSADAPDFAHRLPCCHRSRPSAVLHCLIRIIVLVIQTKPDVVVTTGAAPGAIGAVVAKVWGARVAWIDSIANAEEISLSGRLVRRFAALWLTQWSHLERPGGPRFAGSVL